MGEQILLDPDDEGTGSELDITDPQLGYFLLSHEYPDPEPDVVMTGSIDTEGERPAAGKHKPRTITVTVRCVEPAGGDPEIGTIVATLQSKIGKLFREGGTYRRILPSGDAITFDVQRFGARIRVPADKRWVARKAADVTMTFTCEPYGRGAEVQCELHTEDTAPVLIFTETDIKGDVPAPARLQIEMNNPEERYWWAWGYRSRHYSSETSARLLIEVGDDDVSLGTNTTATAEAGVSGGTIARCTSVSATGTGGILSAGPLTHQGTYRIYARVRASSANTGTMSVRARISRAGRADHYTDVGWVTLDPAWEGAWRFVDLGTVSLTRRPSSVDSGIWALSIDALSTVGGEDLDIDYVALFPAEGSGVARGYSPSLYTAIFQLAEINAHGAFNVNDERPVTDYEGDYLRVPPSGAEGRTIEFIVKVARNDASTDAQVDDDTALDELQAQLSYTPRYLAVPAPDPAP